MQKKVSLPEECFLSGQFSPLNFCLSSFHAGGMHKEGLVEGKQLASNEGEGL